MDIDFPQAHQLSQEQAVDHHADAGNATVLWWVAALMAVVSTCVGLIFFALGQSLQMALALGNLLLIVLLYIRRDNPPISSHPRLFCLLLLIAEMALTLAPLWGLPPEARVALSVLVFPSLVLAFHLRPPEYLLLLLPLWVYSVWTWQRLLDGLWRAPRDLGGIIWPTVATGCAFAIALGLSHGRRRGILTLWRREASLGRERARMREEIEDARQIQLSMLPSSTPQVDWLEISTISMPASEVGGDYYDYFVRQDGSLSLVVGDVAGHGLASGLLLSGLRSCLYLLKDELTEPAAVMRKLDDMVRYTSQRRMLVTLLCAHLDRQRRSLLFSNAGHPPPILVRAGGSATELDAPALPLGTRLSDGFPSRQASLQPGDVLVFYTDGLTEMVDGVGEMYGDLRLKEVVQSNAAAEPREIRNAVLADLANFKGDARRLDDVTLLVVRVQA